MARRRFGRRYALHHGGLQRTRRARTLPRDQLLGGHFGAGQSYLSLLAQATDAEAIAFADQDDVWLPDKLSRARGILSNAGNRAVIYYARQVLVDERLHGERLSVLPRTPPGFPASLTQNIVHGNTLVMNRAAASLVARIPGPAGTVHDWWSYIVVTACGGDVTFDATPAVLYRQHPHNLIGSPSAFSRATAALKRGPGTLMTMMRRHVAQLLANSDCLTDEALRDATRIANGLDGGVLTRSRALFCPGLRRQTELENMLFRLWFVIG